MHILPIEVIEYIYLFDNTSDENYQKCINELKNKFIHQKIIKDINYLSFGSPLYFGPKFIKNNISLYNILKILKRI